VVAVPLARSRFVVQLKRDNARWRWESIAAGDSLYVLVIADGKLAFKERLPLKDRRRPTSDSKRRSRASRRPGRARCAHSEL
jgi:hypothetical protein